MVSKKAKKARIAKKVAAKSNGKARGTTVSGFDRDARITVLVKDNPRRGEVAKRYASYFNLKTVGAYADKWGNAKAAADLNWDASRKNIKIGEG